MYRAARPTKHLSRNPRTGTAHRRSRPHRNPSPRASGDPARTPTPHPRETPAPEGLTPRAPRELAQPGGVRRLPQPASRSDQPPHDARSCEPASRERAGKGYGNPFRRDGSVTHSEPASRPPDAPGQSGSRPRSSRAGPGAPGSAQEGAARVETRLRGHLEAQDTPNHQQRQQVTAASLRIENPLRASRTPPPPRAPRAAGRTPRPGGWGTGPHR